MRYVLPIFLACSDHMTPGEDPASWHCRLAEFQTTQAGHITNLSVQFVIYFSAILFVHWLYGAWRRGWTRKRN